MKSINNNAPVKCSKTILINAKPEKVWAILTNIDHWANWQTDITKPKLNGQLKPTTTFDWKTGGAKIHSTIQSIDEFKYIGWTGKTFGMLAIHNWKLIALNGQTKVEVEESMEGFLAGLYKKSFNKSLETGMQKWLDLLKIESEK
jgi:uncharacterized protein YndB with AHSA1/START domain